MSIVKRAIVILAKTGVFSGVGGRDFVLEAEEEVSEWFSWDKIELEGPKRHADPSSIRTAFIAISCSW